MVRAAAIVLLVLSPACRRLDGPGRSALEAVPLPDISNASAPVQEQIRVRYASLQAAIANARSPAAELAAAYGEMGKLFIAAEYLDAAAGCLRNAATLEPRDMRWPYLLGHVYRYRDDPPAAARYFEQALALAPGHVPGLVWLAEMRLALDEPEQAEALLTRAASLAPASGAVLYGLGRAALARKDYRTAVTRFEEALEGSPPRSRIHYALALAYRELGDEVKAREQLRLRGEVEIAPVDPLLDELARLLQNAAAYEVRGAQAVGAGQWEEAVRNLRKASELAPGNASTRLNLGTALFMTDDVRGALEQFEAALRIDPRLVKAHVGAGIVLQARGRDGEAIAAFRRAVELEPAHLEARLSLADALRRTGRLRESIPEYAAVIAVDPAMSQAAFGHAMALVRLGRWGDARARLEQATATYPDQPGFAHALARVLAAAPEARVRDGRRALALVEGLMRSQQTPALAETMAMALAEVGRFAEAARWQREAIAAAGQGGPPGAAGRLAANLRLYEARQPCRTPWPDDDPVHRPGQEAGAGRRPAGGQQGVGEP